MKNLSGLSGLKNGLTAEDQKILDDMFKATTEGDSRPEIERATKAFQTWCDKNPTRYEKLVKEYVTSARWAKTQAAMKEVADDPKQDAKSREHAKFVLAMGYRNGAFND
jgi:hypothetical protein